jgi:hypothetical protein
MKGMELSGLTCHGAFALPWSMCKVGGVYKQQR